MKIQKKILLTFLLILIITLFTSQVKAIDEEDSDYLYLSDIDYIANQSRPGWGEILKDEAGNGNKISVKVEGAYYTFDKGMWAHATSTLVYDISAYKEKYDYFTAYMGLNSSAASSSNGVKFYVYTSEDGSTWNLRTEEDAPVSKPGADARYVKINIKDANYLKLYADANGANGNDHSVYADAKFVKESYLNELDKLAPKLSTYDEKLKNYENKDLSDPNYELLVLQRKFISALGDYALQRFISESPDNKETINWLMNDLENLRYYILGGAPTGGYFSSLNQLTRLLKEYKSDFDITDSISPEGIALLEKTHSNQPRTKGNLYKRMAITLSLTHSSQVALWMQPSAKENQSDAVNRYKLYKYMYDTGMFKATDAVNITPWFETYNIEEMRYVMNTLIDDEEVIWLNEYTQSKIDASPNSAWGLLTPHSYMAYVWPNYGNPVYYDEENKDYFNDLFKVGDKKLWDYDITRGTSDYKLYKLWMNFRNKFGTGAVCGGISKTGHCIRGVHAIPSAVIGQPGHAAIIYYTKNSNGQGYWGIDNDVSGWTLSEKGERLPLGWGNDRTYVSGYNVPYIALAQEAMNDYENLVKAEEILMTADIYINDENGNAKREEIYRKAIEVQSINLDAWAGLVKLYLADDTKTEEQYFALAEEMMEALKCFPFTMDNLSNKIATKFTSDAYKFKFTLLQTKILTEAKNYPNENSSVLQPSLTRTLASSLLGKLDTELATFSFDGDNAGKIILGSRFDGSTVRWDYSLDGKKTWNEVFSTPDDHTHQLTAEELASITSGNDIYVHIVGVNYSEENLYQIDILESVGLPSTLYANDLENKLIATDPSIKWKYREEDEWTYYKDGEPDLTGNKTIIVKMGATGVYLESTTTSTFTFTEDPNTPERKYIPISHLSVHEVSTEATAQGRYAVNAIDGNLNTNWHSAWNGSDTQKYIVIKLDEPKNLTALEFFPVAGGNGKIESAQILVSMDGENWTEIISGTNWTYTNTNDVTMKNVEFEPVKAQYIKIVGKRTQNSFIAAKMFNLYEDTTAQILGTFSFDGQNAGKIVLDDDVKGSTWKYSLDSEATWKNGNGDVHQLTVKEIESINENDKIKISIDGKERIYTINIKKADIPSITPYVNDWENRLIGINNITSTLEWKIEGTNKWNSYSEKEPIVKGDKKLLVREKAKGVTAASEVLEYQFTADTDTDTAKYIPIKHLSIHSYSTQSVDSKRPYYAPNAIDGNINTIWHTDFRYSIENDKAFIIIKLDEPKYISSLEFVQKKYRVDDPDSIKNVVVYISDDAEVWTEIGRKTNCEQNEEFKRIDFKESSKVEYVKFEAETYGIFASAAMINLYEDTTKKPTAPTAEIEYSTEELTNQDVTATLVNESTNITVTNNNGSKTYTFKENGTFTFEFADSRGTRGTAVATVDWIDKVAPTATISYNISELTDQNVIATLGNPSEEITITNNDGKSTYTFSQNGKFTFEFTDKVGNKGTAEANVYWIMTEDQNYEDFKKQIIEIIENYKSKVTEEELNNKLINKEEKTEVVEGYDVLKEEDKAPYKELIERIKAGGKPVVSLLQEVYRVKAGTEIHLYDFIIITDNEDGNIKPTENNVKITTDLNTAVEGIYNVLYEVKDSDGNVSSATMQIIVADEAAPTAKIKYSTTEVTDGEVVATLVEPSERIMITNNAGSDTYTFTENGVFVFEFVNQAGNKGTAKAEVTWIQRAEDEYLEIKAESIKIIEDYKTKVTEEELNNKNINAEEKNAVIEAYNKLKDEDKAPYTEFIKKVKAGGKPVITVTTDKLTYKEGVDINLYSLIAIQDNEDGEIVSNKKNVKIATNLDTYKAGTYDVNYEVVDKDGNKSTCQIKIVIEENLNPRFKTELRTSKDILIPGDEFEVTVNICEIKHMDKGLVAVTGKLKFDTDIFELISITGENDWNFDGNSFNEEILRFVTENGKTVLEDGDALKIKMKVKKDIVEAKFGETLFELQEIEGSNGETLIKTNDASLTLSVKKDLLQISSDKYEIKDNMILHILPNTTVSEFNKNININRTAYLVNKDGEKQDDQSKVSTGMKLRIDDEDTDYTVIVLGDINEDGAVGITDIARLKLHIVEKRILTDINLLAADIDKDGGVNLVDLSVMKLVIVGLRELK